MNKCKSFEDGIHIVRHAEGNLYKLIYCENCSMNIKWIRKGMLGRKLK